MQTNQPTAVQTRQNILLSSAPRIAAMRQLPNWQIRALYLYKNVDVAELMFTMGAITWAYAMIIPESFIKYLPTYALLLTEASATFWAFCWFIVAFIKFLALITGNLYVRRLAYGIGLVTWSANAGIMYADAHHWNIMVGLSLTFFIGSLWEYVDTKLELDARSVARADLLATAVAKVLSAEDDTEG